MKPPSCYVLPLSMEKHLSELEAFVDIEEFAELCNSGNIGTGRAQPELVCEEACRAARRAGVECDEPSRDIDPKEAMNFVAGLIAQVKAKEQADRRVSLNGKPFLTPPEVAELLGVNEEKVRLWIDDKLDPLPAVNTAKRNGKKPRWKISRVDLDKWLARQSNLAMSTRGR